MVLQIGRPFAAYVTTWGTLSTSTAEETAGTLICPQNESRSSESRGAVRASSPRPSSEVTEPAAKSAESEPEDDLKSEKAITGPQSAPRDELASASTGGANLHDFSVKLDRGRSHHAEVTLELEELSDFGTRENECRPGLFRETESWKLTPVVAVCPEICQVPLNALGQPVGKERRQDEECPWTESQCTRSLIDEVTTVVAVQENEECPGHESQVVHVSSGNQSRFALDQPVQKYVPPHLREATGPSLGETMKASGPALRELRFNQSLTSV
jgi:hypothetical protein